MAAANIFGFTLECSIQFLLEISGQHSLSKYPFIILSI